MSAIQFQIHTYIIRKKIVFVAGKQYIKYNSIKFLSFHNHTIYVCWTTSKRCLQSGSCSPKATSMYAKLQPIANVPSCLTDSSCQHEKQPDNTKRHRLPRSPISRSRSQHEEQTRPDKLLLIIGTWNYDSFRDSSCSGWTYRKHQPAVDICGYVATAQHTSSVAIFFLSAGLQCYCFSFLGYIYWQIVA